MALLLGLALALRLLVWRWHEPYPLGGDESEYFEQALTLLRERRYVELKLMRPPLYTVFLAGSIYLFDSLVQRLRLIQAIISALTVVPIYALTRLIWPDRRVAFVAALLVAANYTLAAHAIELLTETLFLFGLTTLFWLLLAVPRSYHTPAAARPAVRAGLAGLALGALTLLRSVALPLLPLGALWLLIARGRGAGGRVLCSLFFVLGSLMVIGPWTARNYLVYGAPILVDTTGPENLWLDNDPAGREAVKRQLYALGDDRATRAALSLSRGRAAIAGNPRWFLDKAWRETRRFFALQYFDDMRDRRAIWVPPLEVWLRLLLGDALWLIILLGGAAGLWLARTQSGDQSPIWLFVPWALYTLFTAALFHVELRYRLPLYPALIPYAAWALTRLWQHASAWRGRAGMTGFVSLRLFGAGATCLLLAGLTLLHRPYIGEAWMLAWKHTRLVQAERALARGDAASARAAAQLALEEDAESALARVALARALLAERDERAALETLEAAQAVLPAHPHSHLLRGALLRRQGDTAAARREFEYERASLEDLQRWAWRAFAPLDPAPATVAVGGGLDLGSVRGFFMPEAGGFRWSSGASEVLLAARSGRARIDLRLAAPRPPGAPRPRVTLLLNGRAIGAIVPDEQWRIYSLAVELDPANTEPLVLAIRSDTFRPRDFDRASPDNRALGVMVSRVVVVRP